MRKYSLSTDDQPVAIFSNEVETEIRNLDPTKSRKALNAIITTLESPAPESVIEKTYETCKELQQLRQGSLRIYVLLVTEIPGYTILWVFAIKKHRYRNIGKFDAQACRKLHVLREKVGESIEEFLETENALTLERLREIKSRL